MDEGYGVFSLSEDPRSLVMWAHYADSHKGICVGLSTKALQEFSYNLYIQKNIPSELKMVNYVPDYPVLSPFEPDYEPGQWDTVVVCTKSRQWCGEAEYRLVMGTQPDTERLYVLPKDSIKMVILGCMMPTECRDEIRSLVARIGLRAHVIEAELDDYEFDLRIDIPQEVEEN